jgi:phage FluMu gp28-like protein
MPTLSNPHVSAEFVQSQQYEVTARQWAVEYEGRFADSTDSVFKFDHVLRCAIGSEEDARPSRRYVVAWDPAAKRDRSSAVVLDVTERPFRVVRIVDAKGADYIVQVNTVVDLARTYGKAKVVVDASGHGQVLLDLLRRQGAWVEGVVFTSKSKPEAVTRLAVLIEQGNVQFPPSRELLDEFARYEVKTGPTGHARYGASGAGGYDDTITALALAVSAVDGKASVAPGWEALPPFIRTNDTVAIVNGRAIVSRGYEDGFPAESWTPFLR